MRLRVLRLLPILLCSSICAVEPMALPHSLKQPSDGDGRSKKQTAAPAAETFRAVSYNVQFLPGLARYTNERSNPAYRTQQIVEKMAGFDIVGLNETFDDEPRQRIHNGLRKQWGRDCHIIFGPNSGDGRYNGGLSLLSRFPFQETHSVVYENFSSSAQYGLAADGFAAKGVLHARVLLPRSRFKSSSPIDVFVTHFEARDGSLRRKQFDELGAFMSRHVAPEREFLLLGDLNTRGNAKYRAAENSTYNQLFGVLRKVLADHNVVDAWPSRWPNKDGGTRDQAQPTGGPRIDYIIFGNTKTGQPILCVDEIEVNQHLDKKVVALSDHSAVEATIRLQQPKP